MHHEYFLGGLCAFVSPPTPVRKYRKYPIDRWIVVYTVCASAVISPLRQWLDSYAKTRLKMWHTFKHFIHMQYFLLLTNLVIVFVRRVIAGVLYEPRQCSLFGTIFPNLNFVFASLCRVARPVHTQFRSCSTVKPATTPVAWGATKTALYVALSSRNNMISKHQRSVWTNEGKTTLI